MIVTDLADGITATDHKPEPMAPTSDWNDSDRPDTETPVTNLILVRENTSKVLMLAPY